MSLIFPLGQENATGAGDGALIDESFSVPFHLLSDLGNGWHLAENRKYPNRKDNIKECMSYKDC